MNPAFHVDELNLGVSVSRVCTSGCSSQLRALGSISCGKSMTVLHTTLVAN